MSGTLYLVATPIGNLEDLGSRARRILSEVAIVACEDTRRSGRLLRRLGTHRRLVSFHDHNERRRLPQLLAALDRGDSVALISDAGTPLLSDPGFTLVRAAVDRGHVIVAVPGPSAVLTALVASGLPPYPFTFAGFPPPKPARRRRFFARFAELDHTLVFFESPHRLAASLADAETVFGNRPAALGRELTKLHEEVLRGPLAEIRQEIVSRERLKGEFSLVIAGRPKASAVTEGR